MSRDAVIRECIDHLRGQPGRNAIRALKTLLSDSGAVDLATAARLDAAVAKIWTLNGGEDWREMAQRCQGAMFYADAIGRRHEADSFGLLYLIAQRMSWEPQSD